MRYEIKTIVAESDLPRVRSELRLLPTALRPLHPDRTVQSIYFDSPENDAVESNLAGISVRSKLRWRWYGASVDAAKGRLEHKLRINGVGSKDTYEIEDPLPIRGVDRRRFMIELERLLPAAARAQLIGLEPAQWIRYHRSYLGSADGNLRVTLDSELTTFDQRMHARLQCDAATPLPRIGIIEVKADDDQREAAESFVQGMGWRPGRCSKFVIASCPSEIRLATRWADE
jgi:hypothetical protein